jgi:tRNA nucleotidyltransferase (CCA-adding enzyme)
MLERMSIESQEVISRLISSGYEAYFVGGCVRDAFLGRSIQDIDITTSATPAQVMECFQKTVPTGLHHGTVTVIMNQSSYEVTTFRKESRYEAHRRPQEVEFVQNLVEDLRRRDFTMNAMALDRDGKLIDPFGGQRDLASGLLCCVGDPNERFDEDALRMLRCIRFAVNYQLTIAPKTWEALINQASLMRYIAMERVRSELERMVSGRDVHRAIHMLLDSKVIYHMKRSLDLPFERWRERISVVHNVDQLSNPYSRWAFLLLLLGVPLSKIKEALRTLTFSREQQFATWGVLHFHQDLMELLSDTECELNLTNPSVIDCIRDKWKIAIVRNHSQIALEWLELAQVLLQMHKDLDTGISNKQSAVSLIVEHGKSWLASIPCLSIKQLALSGVDLIQKFNQPAGPWVREMLQNLLEQVTVANVENDRDALIQVAQTILDRNE